MLSLDQFLEHSFTTRVCLAEDVAGARVLTRNQGVPRGRLAKLNYM